MEAQKSLLSARERAENDCFCEEWSDDSSCSSYYSDSDSSEIPEWESSIESNGEVLFIDCDPVVHTNIDQDHDKTNIKHDISVRRSTRSKFLKLLRRRDSKRRSKRHPKGHDSSSNAQDTSKVKFQDYEEGEVREVLLKIDHEQQRKLGRRGTPVESLLGITVSTLLDGNRVMVAGFIPDSEAAKQKYIKIGDWLKSINNIEVDYQNLSQTLEQFNLASEVILRLQRVAGVDVTKKPPINELSNQSNFVRHLINSKQEELIILSSLLCEYPVGIIYINMDSLSEIGSEYEGILYCYPKPYEKNFLCISRGVFITLNHLLVSITKSQPKLTSVLCNQQLAHVVYSNFGNNLLLFMLPDNRATAKETILINNEVVSMLQFMYGSVNECFENNCQQLDHFFSRFFVRQLSSGLWPKAEQSVELNKLKSKAQEQGPKQFESVLSVAHLLNLPNEAQVEIDNAMTDLEASDYREWNDDPLDCQRLFTILGSALYHSGYLLASHLVDGDLIDVNAYCRQQGLFHLSRTEPVRSLVLWREVFPISCNRNLALKNSPFESPNGRRYLLIVGSGKDILAVLMEAGGCTEPPEDNMGPDAFYVEEAQATLAHLQDIGIANLADQWIITNSELQVTLPEIPIRRKMDFLGNITFSKSISPSTSKDGSTHNQRKTEVTSILKRRTPDYFTTVDDNYDVNSEDSMSQSCYSERSEVSDEPVLGRRAIRERRTESDEDDSDVDDYREGSNSSYDLSELRQSLITESAETKLLPLTVGPENVLFHYIELDITEGILLCPSESHINSNTLDVVLNNFRMAAQDIHTLFQNTLRFKNLLAQDMTKSVVNKSLIAIKEYGSLFECSFVEDSTKKYGKLTYWVVGRLFYTPHPREVYVCYQDTIPQNMIEIAFKLGVSSH